MKIVLGNTDYSDTKIVFADGERVATVFLSPPYKHRPYPHWRYVWNNQSMALSTEERDAVARAAEEFIVPLNITAKLTS